MAPTTASGSQSRLRFSPGSLRLAAISSCLLLAVYCNRAAAQAPEPAPGTAKVSSVTFTGSRRFAQDALARSIGLAPGTVVSRTEIEAAADRLAGLGWFSEIHYKFDTTSKGVELQFTLQDAPCHPMWFDNFPWFTDAEIENAIRATGLPYDGTAPESGTALDAYREAIAGLLKSKHIAGEVEGELIQAPESENMIERFRVTGGDVLVTTLTFSDPIAQSDMQIQDVLKMVVGKPFSRYNLAMFVTEHVRPAYTSRGYLRARFGEPVAEFIGVPTQPLSSQISVQLSITPGVQYHWGGASWSGEIALKDSELNGLLGLAPAEPVDALKLHAGWDAIGREYAKRGYLDAKLTPVPQYNDAQAGVSYKVSVAEGIQYRMGQLVLTGLSLTAERKLLENWKISRGDVFDNSYYEDFIDEGAQKLFKDTVIHFQKIGHLLRPNPQTKTVDVLLDFQ